MSVRILTGDCRSVLATLPAESVHMVCTSPPYFGLRDYGTATWEGGELGCDHLAPPRRGSGTYTKASTLGPKRDGLGPDNAAWQVTEQQFGEVCGKCGARRIDSQIGLEPSPDEYVATLVEVFREVRRVLRKDGVVFLNLGDSYFGSNQTGGTKSKEGSAKRLGRMFSRGRAERVTPYGTSGKAPRGFPDSDYPSQSLCDGCLAVHLSDGTAHIDRPLVRGQEPLSCAPTREHRVSERDHLPTWDSARLEGHSGDATLDQPLGEDPAPAPPDAALVSTPDESSPQLPAECSHCANCGACLYVLRSSSRDARLCGRRMSNPSLPHLSSASMSRLETSTRGKASIDGASGRHIPDTASAFSYRHLTTECLKSKDLMMIPARVALALQQDGWWLRSDIIWSKPNPMPESVQGSHFSRHMVTIADYERLSGLQYVDECAGDHWAGNVPDLSEIEILSSKAPLSAEREGQGYSSRPRGASGSERETPPVRGVGARTSEQAKISTDQQGEGECGQEGGKLPSAGKERGRHNHSAGLARNPGTPQASLLLLPEADRPNDVGSCYPVEQGRPELTGEHRSRVPFVQLCEAEQTDPDLLVGCPGCDKCAAHHGYLFHMSAGRPTSAHEHVFLLAKSSTYYFDADAVRETGVIPAGAVRRMGATEQIGTMRGDEDRHMVADGQRNIRNVWTIATQPYSGAHFATFPPALVEPCIKAGTSEKGCCYECGAPWVRVTEKSRTFESGSGRAGNMPVGKNGTNLQGGGETLDIRRGPVVHVETTGWEPSCSHTGAPVPAVVLDPFGGAGTVGLVADRLQRDAILIELNPAYASMAEARIHNDAPLLGAVA